MRYGAWHDVAHCDAMGGDIRAAAVVHTRMYLLASKAVLTLIRVNTMLGGSDKSYNEAVSAM